MTSRAPLTCRPTRETRAQTNRSLPGLSDSPHMGAPSLRTFLRTSEIIASPGNPSSTFGDRGTAGPSSVAHFGPRSWPRYRGVTMGLVLGAVGGSSCDAHGQRPLTYSIDRARAGPWSRSNLDADGAVALVRQPE